MSEQDITLQERLDSDSDRPSRASTFKKEDYLEIWKKSASTSPRFVFSSATPIETGQLDELIQLLISSGPEANN